MTLPASPGHPDPINDPQLATDLERDRAARRRAEQRTAVIEITTRFRVDLDAWAEQYDVQPGAAGVDVRRYWAEVDGAALIPAGPRPTIPEAPTTTVKVAPTSARELRMVSHHRADHWPSTS